MKQIEKKYKQKLTQAVARGWSHRVNENKIMDIDLAKAIVKEVQKMTKCKHEWRQLLDEVLLSPYMGGGGLYLTKFYCIHCLKLENK
jgi:hypothetical protein